MQRTTISRISIGVLATVLGTTCVLAATPGEVISFRQAKYKEMGKANKAIQDELRKAPPSMEVVRANARVLAALAPQIPRWYPKGSGPETGIKTGALPAIWQRPADFRVAAVNFNSAARALNTAAARGDAAAVGAAARAVGETCKACHKDFRAKND